MHVKTLANSKADNTSVNPKNCEILILSAKSVNLVQEFGILCKILKLVGKSLGITKRNGAQVRKKQQRFNSEFEEKYSRTKASNKAQTTGLKS